MNKFIYTLLLVLFFISTSCSNENDYQGGVVDFGTVEFYDSFAWVKSSTTHVSRDLKYNFNEYSVQKNAYLTLNFVDANQQIIRDNRHQFYVNEKLVVDNVFDIKSTASSQGVLNIVLKFLPGYKEGYVSGYISIKDGALDVVNNNDLNMSSENRIFKWESRYDVVMNPLKSGLLWFLIVVITCLIFWFLFFRNSIYPKFKKSKIQILAPYFGGINLNKNIKLVVMTNSFKKQKKINSFFTGKIHYEMNACFVEDIVLRPGRGNNIKIKLPLSAKMTPHDFNLVKYSKYKIEISNTQIEIQYS